MSIVVQEVTKLYGSQKALDNVSFSVKTGEIVAFLGPNGAGKSTMMKIITGFIPPSSGSVLVNGTEVSSDDPEIRKKIGYLPENNPSIRKCMSGNACHSSPHSIKPGRSAKENIENIIRHRAHSGSRQEDQAPVKRIPPACGPRTGSDTCPDVLILDEATSGLDP